ncbi:MAG: hypothetical protein ACYTGX_06925 [Planctomycetota bacterium]
MRTLLTAVACTVWLHAAAPLAAAPFGGTVVWEIGARDFGEGTLDGLEWSADGRLVPGREGRAAPLGDGAVTGLAAGRNGVVWAITDAPAQLFRVSDGSAERVLAGAKGETFTCLAGDGAGGVWVGVSGPGSLYHVAAGNPPQRVELPGESVGAVAVDGGGTAWVATGPSGRLHRVAPDGTADQGEAMAGGAAACLQFDGAGGLVAAGHHGGRLERRDPGGRWSVLHEFDEAVSRIARAGDGWIVAGGSTVWRLGADGAVRRLDMGGGAVRALADGGEGAVLIARRTRVWRWTEEGSAVVAELPKSRVAQLLGGAGGVRAIGSGEPGVCVVFGSERRGGLWTSPVRDCGAGSLAGVVTLDGAPGCSAELRWGNVREPDGSWSKWTAAESVPADTRVRYLQVRVRVPVDGTCRVVAVSWLPDNRAPRVHASWRVVRAPAAPDRPVRHFTVEAADRDDDVLAVTLRWRHLGSGWAHVEPVRTLRARPPFTPRVHTQLPAGLPDGRYRLEAVASDAPSNTPERARSTEHHSDPFVVDGTRPVIAEAAVAADTAGGGMIARFQVRDATSRLARIQWSVDGGDWHAAAPADGLLDSRSERFEVRFDRPAAGSHHLRLRALDAAGNAADAVVAFEVK